MTITTGKQLSGTGKLTQKTRRQAIWMVLPAIIYLLVIGIFPLLFALYLIVHKWVLSSGKPPQFIGFGNIIRLIQDERFFIALGRTVAFAVGVVTIEFLLGLLIALLLLNHGRMLLRTFVLLPMIIAPTVVGLTWRFMFNSEIGVLNFFFDIMGLESPLWLGDTTIAKFSIVLVDVWEWTPFIILILLAGLMSLPPDVEEAAHVDGANYWQMLWYVKLPLLRPAIFVALMFRAIDALRTFDTIFVLTAGGPNNVTELLSIYAYKVSFRFFEMGYGTVLAAVLLIIVLLFSRLLVPILEKR
ncbi:MAG: sugar ABC transporter permease [Chloroflexi bacterium]|nr:MAG: sugar ABC transporter permease [Chloroflexota bacterium]